MPRPKEEAPRAISVTGRDATGRPRMLTESLAARQVEAVAALAGATADELGLVTPQTTPTPEAVQAFYALYDTRPVQDNKGGSGFNDSLWLYVVGALLQPQVIVESGVFKGHSTWLLRQACPEAEIHCFDPELGNLVYRDPEARYYEGDWMEAELSVPKGSRGLAFFDDHMDQGRRVLEGHERGFRHLLFDDNFPAANLYATGYPPLPSLEMIFDPSLPETGEFSWVRNGKVYRGIYDMRSREEVKRLILQYKVLPELAPVTRYPPGSGLTLVKLVD